MEREAKLMSLVLRKAGLLQQESLPALCQGRDGIRHALPLQSVQVDDRITRFFVSLNFLNAVKNEEHDS